MSGLKMKIYDPVVDITTLFYWNDEDEYRAAETFLANMGVRRNQSANTAEVDFYLENRQQLDDFQNFKNELEKRRPHSGDPPTLAMNIYDGTTGVLITIKLADEEQHQRGRKFLTDMGIMAIASNDERQKQPELFYFENKQQLNALHEFKRSLSERTKRA